jgi:hypothetical protein
MNIPRRMQDVVVVRSNCLLIPAVDHLATGGALIEVLPGFRAGS